MELLIFGGAVFWIIILIVGFIGLSLAESGQPGLATTAAIVAIGFLCWLTETNPLSWSMQNPGFAAIFVLGYFVAAALWGRIKWGMHVRSERRHSNKLKAEFLTGKNVPYSADAPIPKDLQPDWVSFLQRRGLPRSLAPRVGNNKSRILAWMSYWPFSFVWTMIDDPVRRICLRIYEAIGESFQKYSTDQFKNIDVEDDVQPTPMSMKTNVPDMPNFPR